MEKTKKVAKEKISFTEEESELLKLAKRRVDLLAKDPAQEPKTVQDILVAKLGQLERMRDSNIAEGERLVNQEYDEAQRAMFLAGFTKYTKEISTLKGLIEKVN